MKLSIIIPVFNEILCFQAFLDQLKTAPLDQCESIDSAELIFVDDGCMDGTQDVLQELAKSDAFSFSCGNRAEIKLLVQPSNLGKGAALRRGIEVAQGDIILFQDADLEYSPKDFPNLVNPITKGHSDVVFGTRVNGTTRIIFSFWESWFNSKLTGLSNLLNNVNLTDVMVGYKAFRGDLLRALSLKSDGYGIEPELASKAARARVKICETPISYRARVQEEGKKTGLWAKLSCVLAILRFGMLDRTPFKAGVNQTLTALDQTANVIYAPLLMKAMHGMIPQGEKLRILEIGSGIGSVSKFLLDFGELTATDISKRYTEILGDRFGHRKNVQVLQWDASEPPPQDLGTFDLIVSFNVLEHIEDDKKALSIWSGLLRENGKLVVLVPNNPALYTPIDKSLCHFRRYTKNSLETLSRETGLTIKKSFYGNALGILGWFVVGKVLRRATISDGSLSLYKVLKKIFGPIEKLVERYTGLSLIVVVSRQ